MNAKKWRKSEVVSYLEEKIIDGIATDDEIIFYESYIKHRIFESKYILQNLLREMSDIYENGYN